MAFSRHKWHRIADKETDLQWTPGNIAEVTIDNKKFCIARHQDHLLGFAYTCPHAGAPLTDGYIDKSSNVVCPVHNMKFNLKTGRDVNGEGYKLKTYPVEIRPDGLFIGLDEGGLLKWF